MHQNEKTIITITKVLMDLKAPYKRFEILAETEGNMHHCCVVDPDIEESCKVTLFRLKVLHRKSIC